MNKISKMINEMNNTQKYFLIVSKVSGLYWLIDGHKYWFIGSDQIFAFCIMIGSLLGYFLFKDKKEGIDEKNN